MLFNTNENSLPQQVVINKEDIEVNKSNIIQNSTDIEVNKSNIIQNSTDIDAVKTTADSALSKTEYDEFVTIATSSSDYVTMPDIATYTRLEIQYAGRYNDTGRYEYSTSSVIQMGPETGDYLLPFTSLVWSINRWAHIGGYLIIPNKRFYPLFTTISRGIESSSTYISYGVKVIIRCYK